MSKKIFNIIVLLGLLIIISLSIIIPPNPNKIIKSYTYITIDMPLWIKLSIILSFLYTNIIYIIYDKIYK